jgi:hypothetical protein
MCAKQTVLPVPVGITTNADRRVLIDDRTPDTACC